MKYFVFFLVLIGLIGITIPHAFANDYAEFVIDGHVIVVNSPDVADISLDWDSEYLPELSVNFTESHTGQFQIQIPKNMPRTMNLDFETTLMMDVGYLSGVEQEKDWNEHITEKDFKMIDDRVSETESLCYYIITVELSKVDYFKIATASVASGRWEPVTIENEECSDTYDRTTQNGSVFPRYGYHPLNMSPLKQFNSGIPIDEIKCKDNLVFVQKDNGSPACVKPETKTKLIERGWTTIYSDTYGVKSVFEVVKNATRFDIEYTINGGIITNMIQNAENNSLLLTIDSNDDGKITLYIPHGVIDPIPKDSGDNWLFVLVNGEEVESEQIIDDELNRTVSFKFNDSDPEIEIIAAYWI